MISGKKRNFYIFPMILFCLIITEGTSFTENVWENEPGIPSYDPDWKKIETLWNNGKTEESSINKIISTAYSLKREYPDRVEPILWMAWAYHHKGLNSNNDDRIKYIKRGVKFARSSHDIKKDHRAFLILVSSAFAYKDIDEIKREYGKWIKESVPLPTGRELPPMENYPVWNKALKYWDNRIEIKDALLAVDIFTKTADKNRHDLNAQMWACRSLYYLGRYFEAEKEKKKALLYYKAGAVYGKVAVALGPVSVPANFWYSLNFGKSIEETPFYEKVMHSKDLTGHIMFCCKKNSTYYYCGPMMVAAGAISQESEITREIMEMFGYSLDDILTGLEMAEICYPTYLSIPFAKAEIFNNIGETGKARAILQAILKKNPHDNRLHAAENHITIKNARNMLEAMNK